MGTQRIPVDALRQARYCPTCGHTAVHWGLRTTIEAMVEAHDMRPSGGVARSGRKEMVQLTVAENVIGPPWPARTEQSAADLERWENEGGAPLDAGLR